MSKLYILIILTLSSISISIAQNISVKSFRLLENDLDARVNHPKRDQNNEVCAIIKVVTTQTGFTFDVGSLGVVATEQKAGEIWVYVPRGVQRITISHSQLGVLRNHPLNIPIQAAMVYELVLTTAKVTTTVEEPEIESQWLIITSNPEGANVFIDDMLVGTTPFQRRYREGDYNYRVELPRYHNQAGRISLKGDRQRIDLTLKPNFGDIRVTSTPENGMAIYLNDNNTGKTTPATIEGVASGENTVKLIDSWYQPQAKRVTVNDEKTTTVSFQMQPAFANVTINAKPSANILIDDVQKGNTRWNGRLMEGVYSIRIEKDKHYPQTRKLEIISGKDQSFDFELKPKTGTVNISTIPIDAIISIDGKNYGKTPLTIKDLLVGDYNLTIEKTGYGSINRKITITENKELDIKETLPTGLEVTFETTPSGAELYINGNYQGRTPQNISLEYGNHNIKLVNKSKVVEETINIRQGGKSRWNFNVIDGKEISITSKPSGVSIFINNQFIGKTPRKIILEFGDHMLRLVNDSKTTEQKISVSKYGKDTWDFDVSYGKDIIFRTNPTRANIFINEKSYGITPTTVFLTYGSHQVRFEYNSKKINKTVFVSNNSESSNFTKLFECDNKIPISSNVYGASVFVDGVLIGKTPVTYHMLNKTSTFELKKSGYKPYKGTLNCETRSTKINLEKVFSFKRFYANRISHGFPIRFGVNNSLQYEENFTYDIKGHISYSFGYHINCMLLNWLYLKNELSYSSKKVSFYEEEVNSNYIFYQPSLTIIFWQSLKHNETSGFFLDIGYNYNYKTRGDDYFFKNSFSGLTAALGYAKIKGWAISVNYNHYNSPIFNNSQLINSEILLGLHISY